MDKKCCVRGCNNENYQGCSVSFYSFPTNKVLRAKWVEAIGFQPKGKNPTICSLHFKKADFIPSTLPPKLIQYAVPYMVKFSKPPVKLKFCRICLSMDIKLHHMKNSFLIEMYQNITGIQLDADSDGILQYVCWECTARLRAAADLREKALLSDGLLHDLWKIRQSKITRKDIQFLKENYTCLDSSLVTENVYFTTESNDDPQTVPSKDVEIDIVRNNNYKESEINSSSEDKYDASDTPADDIEDKKITNKILDFDDFGEEIINGSESENTEDDDTKVFKDINEKVSVVDSNNKIILINKKVKKFMLDENDGLFKVDSLEMAKEGVDKTVVDTKSRKDKPEGTKTKRRSNTAEQDKSIENRVDEKQKVQTTSTAKVKIEKRKLKDVGLKTAAAEPRKDVILKQRLRFKNANIDEAFRSLFTITPLTHEQQVEEILKRQESEKYINAPYKCTVCYRGYSDKGSYTTHLAKHDKKSGAYECVICKTRLKTSNSLRKHKSDHIQKYSCKKCPFVTRFRGVALKHEQFHAGTKYQCPHCDLVFDKYSTYMSHLRIKHVSDYVCELCGYTFVNKKGIDVHKHRKHRLVDETVTLEGPYCEVCDVKFASEEAHDRHLRLSSKHISEHDPSRMRNDSQHRYVESKRLRRTVKPEDHQEPHTPVNCEQCGIQLRNRRVYVHHFKRAHPEKMRTKYTIKTPCMCELCGNIFHSKSTLEHHMWVHTGKKQFQCDHCTKSYSQKCHLVIHMQVHSATRPTYECPICGKQFSLYCNRQRHLNTHTDLKPFKCETCGKCFTTATSHRNHFQHFHLKKPWPKRIRRRDKNSKCDDLSVED